MTGLSARNAAVARRVRMPDDAQLGELLLVPGQQSLGEQLHQHGVVALERGPDIDVPPQHRNPVDREVALTAAAFPGVGDRALGKPRGVRLESRRERFDHRGCRPGCIVAKRSTRRDSAMSSTTLVASAGQEPPLVGPVVEQQRLRLARLAELAPPVAVADGDRQRRSSRPTAPTGRW